MIKFNRINNKKSSVEYILPLKTLAKNEEIIFSLSLPPIISLGAFFLGDPLS